LGSSISLSLGPSSSSRTARTNSGRARNPRRLSHDDADLTRASLLRGHLDLIVRRSFASTGQAADGSQTGVIPARAARTESRVRPCG
jgi:hypothetical protein